MTWYLLWCLQCSYQPDEPLPFDSHDERWDWATKHVAGTGHTRLILLEQPSPFKIEAVQPWTTDDRVTDMMKRLRS